MVEVGGGEEGGGGVTRPRSKYQWRGREFIHVKSMLRGL